MNRWKKRRKSFICGISVFALLISMLAMPVLADGTRVVTLGADLSDEQEAFIINYFGVDLSTARVIYVHNWEEREYVGSWIPIEQIGNITISSAYVQPTNSGGIQVKTANLTYVTGNMLASVLSTAGVKNCNIVAAAPFPVSGTGALTGVMIAYQEATGETLDTSKRDLAVQEFTVTQQTAGSIGEQEALQLVNAVKMEVIQSEVDADDAEQIQQIVDQVVADMDQSLTINGDAQVDSINMDQSTTVDNSTTYDNSVTNIDNSVTTINNSLTEEDRQLIVDLATAIAQQQYQYEDVKETLERVEDNLSDQTNITLNIDNSNNNSNDSSIANDNSSSASADSTSEGSILENTDDTMISILTDTTEESSQEKSAPEEPAADQAASEDTSDTSGQYIMEEQIMNFPDGSGIPAMQEETFLPETDNAPLPEETFLPQETDTYEEPQQTDVTEPVTDLPEDTDAETISDSMMQIWNSVQNNPGYEGMDLTAIAYLGQQVVSGTNYQFLCIDHTNEKGLYVATVYQDLDGYTAISYVADFDLDRIEKAQDTETMDALMAGGWELAADDVKEGDLPEDAAAAFQAMRMDQPAAQTMIPVVLLDHTEERYAVLCCQTDTANGYSAGSFNVAFIYTDVAGTYQYSRIVSLNLADYTADGSAAAAEDTQAYPEEIDTQEVPVYEGYYMQEETFVQDGTDDQEDSSDPIDVFE